MGCECGGLRVPLQEQLLAKVSELEADNRALRGTVAEKQSEIDGLKAEVAATKKACDVEVRAASTPPRRKGLTITCISCIGSNTCMWVGEI
jgi:hypothetical protein